MEQFWTGVVSVDLGVLKHLSKHELKKEIINFRQ